MHANSAQMLWLKRQRTVQNQLRQSLLVFFQLQFTTIWLFNILGAAKSSEKTKTDEIVVTNIRTFFQVTFQVFTSLKNE